MMHKTNDKKQLAFHGHAFVTWAIGLAVLAAVALPASADLCVLPDNGQARVDLPLDCPGGFSNPEQPHLITDGLPPDSTIEIDVTWSNFSNIVRTDNPDGTQTQTFVPQIFLIMRGTGGLAGFVNATPLLGTTATTKSAAVVSDDQQFINAELLELSGTLPVFNAAFSTFVYRAGVDNGLPASTGVIEQDLNVVGMCSGGGRDGQACARDNRCPDSNTNGTCVGGANDGQPCTAGFNCPMGECVNPGFCDCDPNTPAIDACSPTYNARSFFDVPYEIEWVGKAGSVLAGLSGVATGTVRMKTGAFPTVVAEPVGGAGRRLVANPGDDITIEVFARDVTPTDVASVQITMPRFATGIDAANTGSIEFIGTCAAGVNQGLGCLLDDECPGSVCTLLPVVDSARSDWIYFGVTPAPFITPIYNPAGNIPPSVLLFFLPPTPDPLPPIEAPVYIGEFNYRISSDAAGDFAVDFLEPGIALNSLTVLGDRDQNGIEFDAFGAIIDLPPAGCDDPFPGDPFVVHGTGGSGETTCTGYVDPRIESTLGTAHDLGIDSVVFKFSEPVFLAGSNGSAAPDTTSFSVQETGGGTPPSVIAVTEIDPTTFQVDLSRLITLQEWTTIIANVEDTCGNPIISNGDQGPGVAETDRIDIAHLPGNINQNNATLPEDLIAFRQFLSSGLAPNPCANELYYDINRDTAILPDDLIRFRQILAGTLPATQSWLSINLLSAQP